MDFIFYLWHLIEFHTSVAAGTASAHTDGSHGTVAPSTYKRGTTLLLTSTQEFQLLEDEN